MPGPVKRRLVLMRHAKSAWPDVADHDRPLAGRGRRDAPVVGRWLQAAGCVPDLVVCSTASRARETWQLAAAELDAVPPVSHRAEVYQASTASLLEIARETSPAVRTLLIVGHDPAIAGLTVALGKDDADSTASSLREKASAKFPTCAVAVLEFSGAWQRLGAGRARLASFVVPRDLQLGSGGS